MEVWVLPRAEPLHQDLRAVVARVRDGQWSRLAELGLRTRTLVLTNTKPPLSSSGHGDGQQQGFTQGRRCWSCGELEGMGETTGLGHGTPRTHPQDDFSRNCLWLSRGCQLSQMSIPPHPLY